MPTSFMVMCTTPNFLLFLFWIPSYLNSSSIEDFALPAQPSVFAVFSLTKRSQKKILEEMMRAAFRKTGAIASRKGLPSSYMGATRTMSGKEIKFGVEGRAAMLKGVDTLADAVQVSSRLDFFSMISSL